MALWPQRNDQAQVKAIYVGKCHIALGNSYYIGKILADKEQLEWARSVKLRFPNQGKGETYVDISGMALSNYSPNQENAIKLVHFFSQ